MSYEDVLVWGEQHHYPSLVLGKRSYLRHGRQHYEALSEHPVRLHRAVKRIGQWNALVARCNVDNLIKNVDMLLTSRNEQRSEPENVLA